MENQNRILLAVTLAVVVIGGFVIWVQREAKARKPVIGWYNLGTETIELKPSGHWGVSYREMPAKFRIEVHADDPVSFGFLTPDTYGHFTSTILQIDFATLPCGAASTINADLNCNTDPSKRYLLVSDLREDSVPEPPAKGHLKNAAQVAPTTLPDNHVTVNMYDWRCIQYCENLPKQ